MQNVNLLDARLMPREPLVRSEWALAGLMVALLAVATHGWLESRLTRQAVAALAASTPGAAAEDGAAGSASGDAATKPANAEHQALQRRVALAEMQLAAVSTHLDVPEEPASTLRQVVAALHESMWLTEIELTGAREWRIAGGTLAPQALVPFAGQLRETHALLGTALLTVRLEPWPMPARPADAPALPAAHRFVLATAATGDSR
jgi:hypothetical protein